MGKISTSHKHFTWRIFSFHSSNVKSIKFNEQKKEQIRHILTLVPLQKMTKEHQSDSFITSNILLLRESHIMCTVTRRQKHRKMCIAASSTLYCGNIRSTCMLLNKSITCLSDCKSELHRQVPSVCSFSPVSQVLRFNVLKIQNFLSVSETPKSVL